MHTHTYLENSPVQFVLSVNLQVWGHPIEHGWPPSDHTLKENQRFLPQKPATANSASPKGGAHNSLPVTRVTKDKSHLQKHPLNTTEYL